MNRDKGTMLFRRGEKSLAVKVVGNFDGIDGLQYGRFFKELPVHEFEDLTLDLTETRTLNTISIGYMAGALNRKRGKKTRIICNDDGLRKNLESFGLDKKSDIVGGKGHDSELDEVPRSTVEIQSGLLNAHKELTALEPKNDLVFKDLLKYLAQKL
jgi:anti-anti-sigma regulatory factor